MDARRQKAHELADRARITFADGCWSVPSQSGNGWYTVIVEEYGAICDCPDFELRGEPGQPCKHIMAVRLLIAREKRGVEQDRENCEPAPKAKRKTYPQAWPQYNAAQAHEREHFMEFLADLCRGIPEPPRKPGPGRPRVPMSDAVYAAVFKVYSLLSARRFNGDLEDAHRKGYVRQLPCFDSVLKCLQSEAVTPILLDLIRRSSLPLAAVESQFAPDSTGFCTNRYTRWFDIKYGITRETADYVKAHVMTGTRTNVITAAFIGDKDAGDSPQMPGLLETTAEGFNVKEVAADAAYASADNFNAADAAGATLYAAFKSNTTGAAGGVFEKMFLTFLMNREEYLKHYHARSNVESTFSAVKRKFGEGVRSKTDVAMRNEVLAKFVAHNICCCITEWYTLGIEPAFGCRNNRGPAEILRFPGA
jgi:transposase